MSLPLRTSPLADAQAALAARWCTVESVQSVAAFSHERDSALEVVAIGDLSHRRRAGIKGPGAAAALASLGLATPARPNSWCRSESALVARLGLTEYLIEDSVGGEIVDKVLALPDAEGVYPVPRFDAELVIAGPQAVDLFRQTCAIDAETLDAAGGALALTSMVGVSVTVAAVMTPAGVTYRVWCDGTYGGYLWETLSGVAEEMGGGPVGQDVLSRVVR
jgi:sarcosine oxidase subunit gamma